MRGNFSWDIKSKQTSKMSIYRKKEKQKYSYSFDRIIVSTHLSINYQCSADKCLFEA